MKPPENDPLTALLKEWDVSTEVVEADHPRFDDEVWRRIAAEEGAGAASGWLGRWAEFWRGRKLNPAWGLAVILVGMSIGAGFGQRAADHERDRQWSQLGQSYANSINPIALASTGHRHPGVDDGH